MKSVKNNKIAIIDNGVNQRFLTRKLEECIYINDQNEVEKDHVEFENTDFLHGTICALIISTYDPQCTIISIRVLEKNGKGGIKKLEAALKWCYLNDVKIVNLSLGTTDFREYDRLNHLINYYTYQGLILVAATSNENYVTYPACFSNVIGVAACLDQVSQLESYIHLGIDRLAIATHQISLYEEEFVTPLSNSYATPFVTAQVSHIQKEKEESNLCLIKRCVRKQGGRMVQAICYEPDWILKAYRKIITKSNAAYYFQIISGNYVDIEKEIDTVIIDSLNELKDICIKNKNLVYLGQEDIPIDITNGLIWSEKSRIKQMIQNTYKATTLELPLIILEIDNELDEYFVLTVLKKLFADDGYYAYTIASKAEGVLYRLEYIPNLFHRPQLIQNFIEGQTHYKQNDLILWSMTHEDKKYLYKLYPDYDMEVCVKQMKKTIQISIWMNQEKVFQKNYNSLTQKDLLELFQNIKHLFVED